MIVFNKFIWLPELAPLFWGSIIIIVSLSLYLIIAKIFELKHKKELIKIFNNGICTECGEKMKQIECKTKYCIYECKKCGHQVYIDDGDVVTWISIGLL